MKIEVFYTYIAICSDKSYYIGMTKDVKAREKAHNLGKGSFYTKTRRPIKIIYFEKFQNYQRGYKTRKTAQRLD